LASQKAIQAGIDQANADIANFTAQLDRLGTNKLVSRGDRSPEPTPERARPSQLAQSVSSMRR